MSGRRRIPLPAKVSAGVFLAVLVPVYWQVYGPANFLWFCDAALILTVAGMWLESPFLISLCATGILLPQFLWLVDLGIHLLGFHFLDLTGYMFDPRLSWFIRGLSWFHGWLPVLLFWLLTRLGYDRRALSAWTVLATGLMLGSYLLALPAGAHPADPNIPINVNYVYGFDDRRPQTWVNQNLYVFLWLGGLWLAVYLPTHLGLCKIFPEPATAAAPKFRAQRP